MVPRNSLFVGCSVLFCVTLFDLLVLLAHRGGGCGINSRRSVVDGGGTGTLIKSNKTLLL